MATPPATPPPESSDPQDSGEACADRPEVDDAERLRRIAAAEQDSAWKAVAYMLTGPLIYGGLGALADHWLGTSWLVGVGIVGGMALSLYLIWFRYGTH